MKKPNIVIIMSDQHNARIMSCAGDQVKTPHLDRLAAEGVRFNNAYCEFPHCVPSRMNFMTGKACHKIGMFDNAASLSSNIPTFAHGLGRIGYKTVLVGRMHFVGNDQHHGFEKRVTGDICSPDIGVNRVEDRWAGYFGARTSLNNPQGGRTTGDEYDQAVAIDACREIYNHEASGDDRPLCMVVGFYNPHDPYRVYERFFRQYKESAELPLNHRGDNLHPFNEAILKGRKYNTVTEDNIKNGRAAYRGKVAFMDELIGMIMERISDSSIGKNCMRIYTSDHGDMIGEHGLWAKNTFLEGAVSIPFLLSWPQELPQGVVNENLVGLGELGPTLLEMFGAETLPGTEGRSFRKLLKSDSVDTERIVRSEISSLGQGGPARMVRKGDWKYNYFHKHNPELFNLKEDPNELNNVADESEYASICEELKKEAFADGWDPEAVIKSVNDVRPRQKYLREWAKVTYPHHPGQWAAPAPL